jgi:cellulose synthase/poly-beta-1,6-N-acetylglucosamine synthase-like glycosyltransferase
MKYTLLITAWKEPETVKQNLENVLRPESKNLLSEMEILLVAPDQETYQAAQETVNSFGFEGFRYIQDQKAGKPAALNLGIRNAKGEIIIAMDGDVIIAKDSLQPLVEYLNNSKYGAVSGRPVSADLKTSLLGYWGNLLADAIHSKRLKNMQQGYSYFVSGYLYAFVNFKNLQIPADTLSDDAWISLEIMRRGMEIAYSPNSLVYVKYPKTLKDWYKQKRRSAGGYMQLSSFYKNRKFNLPKRSLLQEIKFFAFPLTYPKSFRQFLYSLALYPARLILWMLIIYDKLKGNQTVSKLWPRIETTKK